MLMAWQIARQYTVAVASLNFHFIECSKGGSILKFRDLPSAMPPTVPTIKIVTQAR